MEGKQAFTIILKAEKFNEDILIKQFKYRKLEIKIQLIKIRYFDPFFQQQKFQQITSQLMSAIGLKGPFTSTVMTVLADQNSKKGQHEKATTYINRAHQIATEVLDGMQAHKKFINILNTQASIIFRQKKYPEAIALIEKIEALQKEVYGERPLLTHQNHLRRMNTYSEMKGEEYKAEDHIKEMSKLGEQIYSRLNDSQSCIRLSWLSEQMTAYIKIQRLDKVTKIYDEINKEIEAKGLQKSNIKATLDLISLQAEQDPEKAVARMATIRTLCEELEKDLGYKSIISIYLRHSEIAQIFQST